MGDSEPSTSRASSVLSFPSPKKKRAIKYNTVVSVELAHPVVHLSIGDDLQLASYRDGDEEASGDVDDEQIMEDVQVGTQEIEDIVEDKKILLLHSEDPLSMEDMKRELDEDGIRLPVPKKTRHTLQKSLVNLEDHIKYEKEEEIHKIEQLKSDTAIAYKLKPVIKNECVKQTHHKVCNNINSLSETNRTWDHNYALKIISEIEMRTDVTTSNNSLKEFKPVTKNECVKRAHDKVFNDINKNSEINRTSDYNDVPEILSEIEITTDVSVSNISVKRLNQHICDICKKCFRLKGSLYRHSRIHTGEKPYQCHVCKKCFNLKASLDIHIRAHTGEKPYQCQKSVLNSHCSTHTGEQLYQCNICKKCFNLKSNLDRHIRTHTGEQPYQCDICKKCFNVKGNLDRHIRTHSAEQPYQCDICKKCFNLESYLDRHIRTHTGEQPYQCNICKKCFNLKSNLDRHIRTHTDEEPYECDICKKCFNVKANLDRHIRTHTGEKPYQCYVCKKCFNIKSNLDRHIRTHW